jgi:prefoldin subunit 5
LYLLSGLILKKARKGVSNMDINELNKRCDYLDKRIALLEGSIVEIVSVMEQIQDQIFQIIAKINAEKEVVQGEVH